MADDDDRDVREGLDPGPVDSDDATKADAGMAGGTGADQDQATVNPRGAERLEDDDELRDD